VAEIISLRDEPHRHVELLIPWYASGQISLEDAAVVDAHLAGCAQCRAALEQEQRLKAAVSGLPISADLGWEKLQRRLAPHRPPRPTIDRTFNLNWPIALAAFASVQVALLTMAVIVFRPAASPTSYQTLAAPALSAPGNLIVLFRPETSERELRQTLALAGARLVGGPTDVGAYILTVDPAQRDAALAVLRARSNIVLAQPIDRAVAS
jgi:anti-sigma factor RsiW